MSPLSADQVGALLRSPESDSLEFKTDLKDPGQAARLISAIANSGGGRIVVGASPGKGPVGLENPDRTRQLIDRAALAIEPSVPLTFHEVAVDGLPLIVADLDPVGNRGPFIPPDGAIVRRNRQGTPVPLAGSEVIRAFSQVEPANTALGQLSEDVVGEMNRRLAGMESTIDKGFKDAARDRSWKVQLFGWIVSGIIGAAIGVLATALLGQ